MKVYLYNYRNMANNKGNYKKDNYKKGNLYNYLDIWYLNNLKIIS